jgi:hypothetical protein
MAGCTYTDCTIQEVSIASLAGPKRRTKYFYRHTKTTVTPIRADGKLDADREFTIVHTNPGDVAPEIVKLVADANAALGTSLDDLLNTTRTGDGRSTHIFGCADECDCERKKTTLPNGQEVDYPVQEFKSGLPKSPRDVPGDNHPMVVIEKRVNIKGKGLHLVTYEVRIFGTVRRYAGRCVERGEEDEDAEDRTEKEVGMGGAAGEARMDELGGGAGLVSGEAVGLDDRGGRGLFSRPILLAVLGVSLCCCLTLVCVGAYLFFSPVEPVIGVDEPPLVVTDESDDPSAGTELPAGEGTATDLPAPTDTPELSTVITETSEIDATATFTPTLAPTPTVDKEDVLFAAWIVSEIAHFTGQSEIANLVYVLGADPVPVEGAVVTMTMTRPDGSTETLTGVTAADGLVEIVFDIFVFGDYLMTVDAVAAEGYVYAPELDVAGEFVVAVGAAETQTRPADRVVEFYEGFNAAMEAGDAEALFAALHPAVLERYGEAACMTWLGEVVMEPQMVEVLGLVDFGVWAFERDEVSTDIEHAYSVAVEVTLADGTSGEVEAHVALREDASIGWFTDCGEPLD